MGHTNSTTNYSLPQFVSSDKPAWLTDINGAFSDIDTAVKAAKDAGDDAQSDATQALSDAGDALTAANTAGSKASGALSSIAEVFDNATTYSVGEFVLYNNLLYVCTVAVTTPGDWTGATNWARITVDDMVTADRARISTNETNITNLNTDVNSKVGAWTYNGRFTINGFSSANWDLATPISSGTKEVMLTICVGSGDINKRIIRYTIIIPFDIFTTYGAYPDATFGTIRVQASVSYNSLSQLGLSSINDGGGSEMTLNCYTR